MKISLILSYFLIALTSKGQGNYQLILKGQPSRFDSAVAINLPIYRLETKKLRLAPILIDSLGQEIRSQAEAIRISDSLYRISQLENRTLLQGYHRKDSIGNHYRNLYHDANKIAQDCLNRRKTWVQDPKTFGIAGIVLGIIIKGLID